MGKHAALGHLGVGNKPVVTVSGRACDAAPLHTWLHLDGKKVDWWRTLHPQVYAKEEFYRCRGQIWNRRGHNEGEGQRVRGDEVGDGQGTDSWELPSSLELVITQQGT